MNMMSTDQGIQTAPGVIDALTGMRDALRPFMGVSGEFNRVLDLLTQAVTSPFSFPHRLIAELCPPGELSCIKVPAGACPPRIVEAVDLAALALDAAVHWKSTVPRTARHEGFWEMVATFDRTMGTSLYSE